jgi:putative restriction endonuclease
VDAQVVTDLPRRACDGPVLGRAYLRKARLGQGAFRLLTAKNYHERCCITGESTLPVLEAAHIRPVAQEGDHTLSNGLLMRADMHILYDRG